MGDKKKEAHTKATPKANLISMIELSNFNNYLLANTILICIHILVFICF